MNPDIQPQAPIEQPQFQAPAEQVELTQPQAPKKKKGKTVLALLLALILIIAAAAGGWYYGTSQAQKEADARSSALNSQISNLQKKLTAAEAKQNTKTAFDSVKATQLVKTFYASYSLINAGTPSADTVAKSKVLVAANGTPAFIAAYGAAAAINPVFCAQDIPSSVNVSTGTIKASYVSVPVETVFSASPKRTLDVQVVPVGNDYKIDKIVCPAN